MKNNAARATGTFTMNKSYSHDSFLYGVVYYPEQWPEFQWDLDLSRIVDTGMNVVRMGEGAWSVWEPQDGHYDFALFDRALELCQKHGLKAIMGTPTYTPPAWLTERYPEVLRVSFDGRRLAHGSRRHYNYTSPTYQKKCRAVIEALGEHYKTHPAVIGWQIDNELNCHVSTSFAESDHLAFRAWCRQRYGTLEALNKAWGTVFWSQTYCNWEEVWLPRPTATYQNPSLLLDFFRFTSEATIRFAAMQYEIVKRIAPHQFVTHNAFHDMANVDLGQLVREAVDFLWYDSYPEFLVCDTKVPKQFRIVLSPGSSAKYAAFPPSSWCWNNSRDRAARSAESSTAARTTFIRRPSPGRCVFGVGTPSPTGPTASCSFVGVRCPTVPRPTGTACFITTSEIRGA